MSRTINSIRNIFYSVINIVLSPLLLFIVRTVFVKTLDKKFLGLNGLFSNIFSILALAELGIGTAILYKLYKPLAHKDEKRICILMNFYKTSYQIMSIIILILGIALLPFIC